MTTEPHPMTLGLDYCYAEWAAARARHADEVRRLQERLDACEAALHTERLQHDETRGYKQRAEGERDEAMTEAAEWQKRAGSLESRLLDLEAYRRGLEQRNLLEGLPLPQSVVDDLAELTARRARDADVRVVLEYCDEDDPTPGGIGGLARELLAAGFLQTPCPECHMVERCELSCSRGGSKGARVDASLIQSDPLAVTIRRISADEHEPDRVDIDVRRGELRVLSTEVYRGELLYCDADITARELHQINGLLLSEWSVWGAANALREGGPEDCRSAHPPEAPTP